MNEEPGDQTSQSTGFQAQLQVGSNSASHSPYGSCDFARMQFSGSVIKAVGSRASRIPHPGSALLQQQAKAHAAG